MKRNELLQWFSVLAFSLAAVALCTFTSIALMDITFDHFVNKLKPGFEVAQEIERSRAKEIEDATRIMERRDRGVERVKKLRESFK